MTPYEGKFEIVIETSVSVMGGRRVPMGGGIRITRGSNMSVSGVVLGSHEVPESES